MDLLVFPIRQEVVFTVDLLERGIVRLRIEKLDSTRATPQYSVGLYAMPGLQCQAVAKRTSGAGMCFPHA